MKHSNRNDYSRVSAPDTTEGTKKRRAELEAKRREEERPKLVRATKPLVSREEARARLEALRTPVSPEEVALKGYMRGVLDKDGSVVSKLGNGVGAGLVLGPMVAGMMYGGKGNSSKWTQKSTTPVIRVRRSEPQMSRLDLSVGGVAGASSSLRPVKTLSGTGADRVAYDHPIMYLMDRPPARSIVTKGDGAAPLGYEFVKIAPVRVKTPKYLGKPRELYIDPEDYRIIMGGGTGASGVSPHGAPVPLGPGIQVVMANGQAKVHPVVSGKPNSLQTHYQRELRKIAWGRKATAADKMLAYERARDLVDTGNTFMEALGYKKGGGTAEFDPEAARSLFNEYMRTKSGYHTPHVVGNEPIPELYRTPDKQYDGLFDNELKSYDLEPFSNINGVVLRSDLLPAKELKEFQAGFERNNVKVFIHDNIDEAVKTIREHSVRQASKGGHTPKSIRAAEKAGDTEGGSNLQNPEVSVNNEEAVDNNVNSGGPRIVINPSTFKNSKDALCVAFNEGFRVIMELNAFNPVSEPTKEQRRFFSDTAYADDEVQLRRTILARVCTLDTSVPRPTDSQIQEAIEFLHTVLEIGACQNDWEQSCVQKLIGLMEAVPVRNGGAEKPAKGLKTQDAGGGMPADEEMRAKANATATEATDAGQGDQSTPEPSAQQAVTDNTPTAVVPTTDGGTVYVPGGINGQNVEGVISAMNAKVATDYKDGGVWRDKDGQRIGNDDQYKQYQEAQKALAGTGAYYDGGVFRDKDGQKIGGNLEAVNDYMAVRNGTKGTGAYYDGGVWRDKVGKKLDTSEWVKPKQDVAAPAQKDTVQNPAQQNAAQGQPQQGEKVGKDVRGNDIVNPAGNVVGRDIRGNAIVKPEGAVGRDIRGNWIIKPQGATGRDIRGNWIMGKGATKPGAPVAAGKIASTGTNSSDTGIRRARRSSSRMRDAT